jgi:hypothetical protein
MESFPEPLPGFMVLLVAPRRTLRQMLPEWAAGRAADGAVRVLDCGNSFQAYALARALRSRTPQLQAALQRVSVARAFTCYQAAALLAQTPADGTPTLLLDLPDTFMDDSVGLGERRRLFYACVQRLLVLKARMPLLAGYSPPALPDEKMPAQLEDAADFVWRMDAPPPGPVLQPGLW